MTHLRKIMLEELRQRYRALLHPHSRSFSRRFNQRTFVIRVRQGKAEWVDVKTGVTVNGETEIFGDVHPSNIVVAIGDKR